MMVSKGLKLEKIEREREDFNINAKGVSCTNYTDMFKGCDSLSLVILDNAKEDTFDVSKLSLPEGREVEFVEK